MLGNIGDKRKPFLIRDRLKAGSAGFPGIPETTQAGGRRVSETAGLRRTQRAAAVEQIEIRP